MTRLEAIEEYQCLGCSNGPSLTCVTNSNQGSGCGSHCPGTMVFPAAGTIFLGLPKGFCRRGCSETMPVTIFESWNNFQKEWSGYEIWNIPCWKHLDEHGNTLVRGLSPRINSPFLHIILGDCRDKIDCLEITEEIQKGMD